MTDVLAGYVKRIGADCPSLQIASARLNSDGMMNDAVVINDDLVFRFAKNEKALTLLAYEAQLLDIIGRYLTVPVPRIEQRTDVYLRYRHIPGSPLYRHTLLRTDPAIQNRLAYELATFLQQLHAIPLSEVPDPPWQATAPSESLRTKYEQRLVALERDVYPLLWADQKDWVVDLFASVLDGRVDLDAFTPVFLHRDLACYHILHDPQTAHLTGVIDYGTAGAGDPATDWALDQHVR